MARHFGSVHKYNNEVERKTAFVFKTHTYYMKNKDKFRFKRRLKKIQSLFDKQHITCGGRCKK